MNLEKECVNRFLSRCSDCKKDLDLNKHPNNFDCPNYKELKLFEVEIKENNSIKENETSYSFFYSLVQNSE